MNRILNIILLYTFFIGSLPVFAQDTLNNINVYTEVYNQMKANYPLFEYRKHYNIDSSYFKFYNQAKFSKSQKELQQASCSMLSDLNDFHVRLFFENGKCFAAPVTNWHSQFNTDSLDHLFWANSDSTLYEQGFESIQSRIFDGEYPMIRFSRSKDYAYLNLTRFEYKFNATQTFIQAKKVAKTMDEITTYLKDCRAIIIDMRSCQGGFEANAEAIASRLIDSTTIWGESIEYSNASDIHQKRIFSIEPKGNILTQIPIVILTNEVTRSCAEEFIMMIKASSNNVYTIGVPTWGSLAWSNTMKLKSSWTIQYSTQLVKNLDQSTYEGRGIPVDLGIENKLDDLVSKEDKVIMQAIQYLNNLIE